MKIRGTIMFVKRKRLKKSSPHFLRLGISAGLLFLAALFFFSRAILADLPDAASLAHRVITQSTKIYDKTGAVLLYEIHGGERRTVVLFEEIPDSVKRATLAAEDADFYAHPAFHLKAIARAVLHNLTKGGVSLQGGSTITQQLIKNSFLRPERTLTRKVKELILAIRFEKLYSKDEILAFYLNQIPYGSNAYGVEAASQTFFAKSSRDLTLAESALLAALPKAPSYFSPYGSHNEELRERQYWILDRMAALGFISSEEAEKAKKSRLKFAKQSYGIRAPHFVMYMREILEGRYGKDFVENGGLEVITTLDWELQKIAEGAVQEGAERNKTAWRASNAALTAVDTKTGQILAMVGSRDYFEIENSGNVNVVTRVRQPGSAFKPFVYLAAFRKGYTPDTILFDVPTEFTPRCSAEGEAPSGEDEKICYHPENYDGTFRGPVTMRQALAQSLNVPSVQALYLAGVKNTLGVAKAFGITTLEEPPHYYGLSLVLGGGGVKLLEMVGAFSAFAQEGVFRPPTPIISIRDSEGTTVEAYRNEAKRVFEARYARVLNNVLSDDASRVPAFQPQGPLTLPGRPVAAKTGTSQDYRDAWVIGYAPSLAAGVWVGNNDNTPMEKAAAGVMAAAPIWNAFMSKALEGEPVELFPPPDPLPATKPILRGEYRIPVNGAPEVHATLFWVRKDDPLGPPPDRPEDDPQFANWETAVQKWAAANLLSYASLPLGASPPPHATASSEAVRVEILSPQGGSKIGAPDLTISAKVSALAAAQAVLLFWNGELVTTFDPQLDNTYTIYFVPSRWRETNEIKVQAHDASGAFGEARITVFP